MAALIIAIVLNALSCTRDWRGTTDRREFDGERYTERCVGRYQQPETWMCLELAR